MTWKIEAGIVGGAALVLGGFLAVMANQQDTSRPDPVDHFIQSDYDVFDRDFKLGSTECAIGLASQKICMHKSPLEKELQVGQILPAYIPALGAEFRIIVETALKSENLRTVRYGQTLVLIDANTREVKDILRLNAPDFLAAQGDAAQPKV
ncbi:hypothetical protein [Hyphomonas chukchiensis]|uniref:Uncharacterized protein n=1 Tax=Hyphomonas chukchiensis TaxID=1280947 RepID=A0A062UHL2_9PROT|nr:hypothetical protein [Hyphomonas chukchiensis]KCZ57942.1 hypothetical protein HY30_16920 [Hyphomonas chukchiensis]